MKKFLYASAVSVMALFLGLIAGCLLLSSCEDLFSEHSNLERVNLGEVGDKDTYLTHFVNRRCNWKGMKKTLFVKKGDPDPTVVFVYNKQKFGGVVMYECTYDSTSMKALVDETPDFNKKWGALQILVSKHIDYVGEREHNVTFKLYNNDNELIVERHYTYTVVSVDTHSNVCTEGGCCVCL